MNRAKFLVTTLAGIAGAKVAGRSLHAKNPTPGFPPVGPPAPPTRRTIFQDYFHRPNESPTTNNNWGPFQETGSNAAQMQVASNVCEAITVSVRNTSIVGASLANDQWAEAVIGTVGAYTSASVRLRCTSGNPGTAYDFTISGGAWFIQIESGATFTTLATVASGALVAAGDTLRFEAVGTTLTGYKNGFPVITVTDATLASGKVGLRVNPGAGVTSIQFSQFRAGDFSTVTPGLGVWTKQGVCVGQLNTNDTPGQPNVFYEANPIILSANSDGKIFKMWFGSLNGVCYAESNDGLKWTRYSSNPVLVPSGTPGAGWNAYPRIYKDGSTYYAYVVNPNFQSMSSWHSTDGVAWTLGATKAITPDQAWSGGATPNFIGQLNVAGKIGSTYYGYYEAYDAGLGIYPLGKATSTDLLNWTADSGNPFSTADSGNMCFRTIGTSVYSWSHRRQDGIPHFGSGNGLPSDITRHRGDTPAGPFPALLNSVIYRTDPGEGVDTTIGQVADPSIIEVNGITYLYATYTATGNGAPTNYRIECFTSTLTLAQLVETLEGVANVPQPAAVGFANQLHTLATDPFTVGDPNWTTLSAASGWGAPTFASASAHATTNAVRGAAYYSALSWASKADQWASVVLKTNANSSCFTSAFVRGSVSGAATCYAATVGGAALGSTPSLLIQKFVAGVYTLLFQSTATQNTAWAFAANDVLTISVIGNLICVYQNANLLWTVIDNDITSGAPGFVCLSDTTVTNSAISSFSAGDFAYTIGGNAGIAGATISDGTNTATSDSDGVYVLSPESSGTLTVTPTLAGKTFSPNNSSQTMAGVNITGVDFTVNSNSATQPGAFVVGP